MLLWLGKSFLYWTKAVFHTIQLFMKSLNFERQRNAFARTISCYTLPPLPGEDQLIQLGCFPLWVLRLLMGLWLKLAGWGWPYPCSRIGRCLHSQIKIKEVFLKKIKQPFKLKSREIAILMNVSQLFCLVSMHLKSCLALDSYVTLQKQPVNLILEHIRTKIWINLCPQHIKLIRKATEVQFNLILHIYFFIFGESSHKAFAPHLPVLQSGSKCFTNPKTKGEQEWAIWC